MWSNHRPPSRTSPGDHYNNNSASPNPYSRGANVTKMKPGRQSTDPWDWGWDENNGQQQQDDWNNGWNQSSAPAPNVIPNPSPSLYHLTKPEKKAHGTPDLIPEKVNNYTMPSVMQMGQQLGFNQVSNASDFFENIDLNSQNNQIASQTPMYNPSDTRQIHQPPQNYQMYSSLPPQHTANMLPSPASYFRQSQPSHSLNSDSSPYYKQPPPPPPTVHSTNVFPNSQFYQPEINPLSAPQLVSSYCDQNKLSTQDQHNYYDQNAFLNTNEQSFVSEKLSSTSINSQEVENIEVAPPEQVVSTNQSDILHATTSQNALEDILTNVNEPTIPDNQETVPDNEEHLQNLPQKLSQMKISSSHNLEALNGSPGWENQEIAPRCELDRNQYLETGQLAESKDLEEVSTETDNNDEVEALPPPGLHRMVTGQGTESISQRSVLGQPPSLTQNNNNGFIRLVPGHPTPSASPEPMSLERLVPGQLNNANIAINSTHRMIPGHQSQDSQILQRFSTHQESKGEMQRLIPGKIQNDPPIGVRMIPGQLSDDENNISTDDLERMIPGRMSEQEANFTREVPDENERMVPGGMSDDSRSQSMSNDDETRHSSERMIPGMTLQCEPNSSKPENQTGRLVAGAGNVEILDAPNTNSQEVTRHVFGQRSDSQESVKHMNQPPPGLHRLVLGQINSEGGADSEIVAAKPAERSEDKTGGNTSGMQRMVVGQFREKEQEPENEKEKESLKNNDRDDDSDSDYRSERRRHRHRKDSSYEDERKERDYSSEREYRGKREDRREYRKKRESSYNRSPEYQSDHDDYDRNDYRDQRERDRRDRPRDRERDRRRRSPEYRDYDPYYRDDPRRLPPRERDRRYYEPYEDDPYYYRENRSRPSSRSGSEYRRHRDYPPRHPYYPEPGGMSNYMQYYQFQQYYENMRRNDPQRYAQWYEQYMANKFSSASNDRASVHSGRSSANENSQSHDIEEEEREGVKADDTVSHRSTPPLYSSAHIRGQFNTLGQLVVVHPHDPFSYGDHQATVTVCKVTGPNAADTPDVLEFLNNPGPFISGVTHKNTVLQYLKKQSDQFSHSSEKLLYDLIRLVVKLNGVVDMTDVADLLMESYRNSTTERDLFPETSATEDVSTTLSPHQITSKFRELLLEGNKNEALEWAMKNKDWGHALFLASKMDSRTHNSVMLRFANGLQSNDPLQTLYQLMSGREPQAATCAADKKWGDWRPHLAMMLSNRTANIELDRKSILTLGDSLGSRGRLYASHFCYLTAQLEFSNYSDPHAKLVLLGASADKPFIQFATCRAIMLTLCYEYAKQLSNKDWCIPTLRPYKFILACRLFDHGNLTSAMAYLESLSQEIVHLPVRDDKPLAQLIIDMADKIKFADNSLAYSTDPSTDPDWLVKLKFHLEETNDPNYLHANMTHAISTSTVSDLEPSYNRAEHTLQPAMHDINQTYPNEMASYTTDQLNAGYPQENYYDHTQNSYYDPSRSMQPQEVQPLESYNTEQHTLSDNSSIDYWSKNSGAAWGQQPVNSSQIEQPTESAATETQPQISVKPGFGYFETSGETKSQAANHSFGPPPPAPEKPEIKEKTKRRTNKTQSGSGWFGGIWDKLALRPKNQMILPDDKDPAIVWDEKNKKWVNTDATEEEQSAQLKPPPKASELNGSVVPTPSVAPVGVPNVAPAPSGLQINTGLPPPAASSTNKYKLQRGKGMRSNYVDIMGSSKKSTTSSTNSQPLPTIPQAPVPNFFVPAPVSGIDNAPVDFLSPSGPVSFEPTTSKPEDQPPPGGYTKGNSAFFSANNYQS